MRNSPPGKRERLNVGDALDQRQIISFAGAAVPGLDHHRVLGPSLFVVALKDERGCTDGEYRYVTLKDLFKAQRLIKRDTGADVTDAERNHGEARDRAGGF